MDHAPKVKSNVAFLKYICTKFPKSVLSSLSNPADTRPGLQYMPHTGKENELQVCVHKQECAGCMVWGRRDYHANLE